MMWAQLIRLSGEDGRPLQWQIRQAIVSAISERLLAPGTRLPSSRDLAAVLDVARNTVVLAYQQLVDEGILAAQERSGHYVAQRAGALAAPLPQEAGGDAGPDWEQRLLQRPSQVRNIVKPADWQTKPYPFVYGQSDPELFPVNDWRECVKAALGTLEIRDWSRDLIDGDDPLLIAELRKRVLPLRGVWASEDEVMVTLGAQQALFLIANLLIDRTTRVGMEEPGYPDARNIFASRGATLGLLPLDGEGLIASEAAGACDLLYVTPSHQCPTTVTMPLARRHQLLALAQARDCLLIEDDYELETPADYTPLPALKSLDRSGRVLYVGSLSKTLAPGLRLGFLVAPPPVIRELRALRRLMLRHPPANNQRAAALFISLGHYEAHLKRLSRAMHERQRLVEAALPHHLPAMRWQPALGTTSLWVRAPGRDTRELARQALAAGVVIEPGDVFFGCEAPPTSFFRLGFSAIPAMRIERGIAALARVAG